jgi:hypothetical protein
LVNNRHTQWTKGSYTANSAISFEVTAKVTISGAEIATHLSDANLGRLSQDETDRLRQEYYDYQIPVPARSEVVHSLGGAYNGGNYGVQLSVGLDRRYNAIVGAYRGRQVTVTVAGHQYNATIPMDAAVTISSAYRNPQRNKIVGSVYPDSAHTRGRALDLVPGAVSVTVNINGHATVVALSLHQNLYPALRDAAATQGSAISEHGAVQVPVGDTTEDHIHVQWQ